MTEASQITPRVLEKAFLAVGHGLGFLWGSIWSEGLGEDRETMKMSMIEGIILGTEFERIKQASPCPSSLNLLP